MRSVNLKLSKLKSDARGSQLQQIYFKCAGNVNNQNFKCHHKNFE